MTFPHRHSRQLMQPNFDSDIESEGSCSTDEHDLDGNNDEHPQRCDFPRRNHRLPRFLTIPQQGDAINLVLPSQKNILSYIQKGHAYLNTDPNHDSAKTSIFDLDIDPSALEMRRNLLKAYHKKRKDTYALASQPGSHLDEDMILTSANRAENEINGNDNDGNNIAANNIRNPDNNLAPNPINADAPNPLRQGLGNILEGWDEVEPDPNNDEEDEERRVIERMEREAALVVANVVKRYRESNIPEDDFILIRPTRPETTTLNLTIRRILFVVLAIVTAFLCIMFQTFPLLIGEENFSDDEGIDRLLPEVMHIRDLRTHAANCGNKLDRSKLLTIHRNKGGKTQIEKFDCSDQVLHIPSMSRIYLESSNSLLDPIYFARNGLNISWTLPCNIPVPTEQNIPDSNQNEKSSKSSCFPLKRPTEETSVTKSFFEKNKQCKNDANVPTNKSPSSKSSSEASQCFRGIHDGIINLTEIDSIILMGGDLVERGGTHLDIHRNISDLLVYAPSVIAKLKMLLQEAYGVKTIHQPIAFRVSITLPLDPDNWHFQKGALNLINAVNRTTLAQLEKHILSHNYEPSFFKPVFTKPFRDPCILLSDLEAVNDFEILTSIFLSGDDDYSGGASLFVDDHIDNSNPKKKIRRGVVIDGTKGRVLVSTGGIENRRCRFPTREGIRAVLQIWWGCDNIHIQCNL